MIKLFVSSSLLLDVLLDEGVLHGIALRKRTHKSLNILALAVHEHVVILDKTAITFLYEIYFIRSAYFPCYALSLNSRF